MQFNIKIKYKTNYRKRAIAGQNSVTVYQKKIFMQFVFLFAILIAGGGSDGGIAIRAIGDSVVVVAVGNQ